jgi:peptide/nickel transport system ATP-binding protein
MLTARGIALRYSRTAPWVLDDVHIEVAPGRVVGLWGPSGCGKTTLGAVLAGIRTPQRGTVEVDGAPLSAAAGPRPVQLVAQHAAAAMNPRWKVDDLLAEAGEEPAVDEDRLVDARWLDRFPHEISGGELQRVNLARALRARPRYLVADEISASLDAITQAILWRHLREQVALGLGVLAVSHDRALLDAVADEVRSLEPGPGPAGRSALLAEDPGHDGGRSLGDAGTARVSPLR